MNSDQLNEILKKPGYGIVGTIPKSSIRSTIGPGTNGDSYRGARSEHDLESDISDESLGAKKLQINYSGKVRVRVTFYRRRLADYSRAISEKALVDCLQYGGIIQGDSEEEIWLEDGGQKKVESDQEEKTVLELFYQDVDFDNLWVPAKQNKAR